MMNTVNASTGFSPFQLRMGRSPQLIPPLNPEAPVTPNVLETEAATKLINDLFLDVKEAQDNLLAAKLDQAEFANQHCGEEVELEVGDKVLLSTEHRRCEHMQAQSGCSAKFMPCFDSPYTVTAAFPTKSSYTLHLPNEPKRFPTFHSSLLCRFVDNDPELFPSRSLAMPGPVVTPDGEEEWLVEKIVDEWHRGRGYQYLVRWSGYGVESDCWVRAQDLEDNEALDVWLRRSEGD